MAFDNLDSSYHSRSSGSSSQSRSPPPFRVDEEQAEDDDDDDHDDIALDMGINEEMDMLDNEQDYLSDEEMNLSSHSSSDPSSADTGSSPVYNTTQTIPTWRRSSSYNFSNNDDSVPRAHAFLAHPYESISKRRSYSLEQAATCGASTSTSSSVASSSFMYQGGFFYLAFCLCAMTAMYTSRATLTTTLQQVALLDTNRAAMDAQLQNTERGLLRIKRQIQAIDVMRSQQDGTAIMDASSINDGLSAAEERRRQENTQALKELHGLQHRLKDEASLVARLKNQVRETAKRDLIAKYGAGPHRVEMELVFPDRKMGGANKFVIELADVEMMPHSVYTFLQMVSLGLLDGCSFILNALHVVKAAPLPYDGSSAAQKAQDFTKAGLESVAFKEYSPEYPHKQYTVGFAADGSPSFFINTENNADVHAGDPCFGTIVSGLEAIKRLEAQPTRNGIWFEKRIGIKAARILKG
ncbi:hypothetical protein MPSEU_000542700 [Mayamaea pseudoterrestris]|nr:hypothetical protein MPSEU_000542700 [Mayamaea pseudoterrestris]